MIAATDTLWTTFVQRLSVVNPSRVAVGYMDAQDWPPQGVQFNAFYLLEIASNPLNKATWSWTVPFYEILHQFVWIVKGTDVSNYNDNLGKTRGDRVRINSQMKEELLQSLYPGFAQKVKLSVNSAQNLVSTALNEPVVWNQPQFHIRADKESGNLYGTATVKVTDMTESIAS